MKKTEVPGLPLILQVRDFSHVRQPYAGGVDEAALIFHLAPDGGGDLSLQLPPHASGPKKAEPDDGIRSQLEILVGAESGRVILHIRRNQLSGPSREPLKPAAFKISRSL